eukprot:5644327-Lingulodinium_polyedra.AAC.1
MPTPSKRSPASTASAVSPIWRRPSGPPSTVARRASLSRRSAVSGPGPGVQRRRPDHLARSPRSR